MGRRPEDPQGGRHRASVHSDVPAITFRTASGRVTDIDPASRHHRQLESFTKLSLIKKFKSFENGLPDREEISTSEAEILIARDALTMHPNERENLRIYVGVMGQTVRRDPDDPDSRISLVTQDNITEYTVCVLRLDQPLNQGSKTQMFTAQRTQVAQDPLGRGPVDLGYWDDLVKNKSGAEILEEHPVDKYNRRIQELLRVAFLLEEEKKAGYSSADEKKRARETLLRRKYSLLRSYFDLADRFQSEFREDEYLYRYVMSGLQVHPIEDRNMGQMLLHWARDLETGENDFHRVPRSKLVRIDEGELQEYRDLADGSGMSKAATAICETLGL